MQRMFSIALNKKIEFSVVGIANMSNRTIIFQGLINGVPFTENSNYEKIRSRVMMAVEINQPQNKDSLS
jgi:hypothetical protein